MRTTKSARGVETDSLEGVPSFEEADEDEGDEDIHNT